MRVELSSLAAVGAGHAGSLVPIFFFARCCSIALAAILWARGADLELVVAEEMGVLGGGQVGGQFADLTVNGLVNSSGQVLDLGLLRGRQGCRCHGGLRCKTGFSSEFTASPLVYKNSTNFQDAHRTAPISPIIP